MMTKRLSGISGRFIHPVCEKSVIAGQWKLYLQGSHANKSKAGIGRVVFIRKRDGWSGDPAGPAGRDDRRRAVRRRRLDVRHRCRLGRQGSIGREGVRV